MKKYIVVDLGGIGLSGNALFERIDLLEDIEVELKNVLAHNTHYRDAGINMDLDDLDRVWYIEDELEDDQCELIEFADDATAIAWFKGKY